MKAIIFPKYGNSSVLKAGEKPKPEPKENEVLIKVFASSLNKGDWYYMTGTPFPIRFMAGGLFTPKHNIPGGDVAGIIEKIGSAVTDFKIGDEVFGEITESGFGGWAEYVCAKTDALVHKPKDLEFTDAASLPVAGLTALQALRDHGNIQAGHRVLVNGATGGVGMFSVLLGKYFGAHVTAVCSTEKLQMVQSLGADEIIDYKLQDPTQNEKTYDIIVDCAAYRSFSAFKNSLTEQGAYVLVGGSMKQLLWVNLLGPFSSSKNGKKYCNFLAQPNKDDLNTLGDIFSSSQYKPYIQEKLPLSEAPRAVKMMEIRQLQGKIVIEI